MSSGHPLTIGRRHLIAGAAAAMAVAAIPAGSAAASPKPAPLPEELESGDLLWPKKPGVFVPFSFEGESTAAADEQKWLRERDAALAAMQESLSMDNVAAANALRDMSYAAFRAQYLEGRAPGETMPYSFGTFASVGHVAIVLIEDGEPRIVEAMPDEGGAIRGVITSTYADWLADGPGNVVWHGRIKDRRTEERHKVALVAATHLGTRYDFWNFNLADPAGFYCSKLAWLAAWNALSMALDGDPNPLRGFWLSPKQLLNANTIEILLDQGDYGFD